MNTIEGLSATEKHLPSFEWVRDIQYFEGPLLSEYKTSSSDTYVFYWCDCSETLNRWLAVRVSRRSLLELTAGLISIHELITQKNQDRTLIILDFDEDVKLASATITDLSSIPDSYLPEPDEIIDPELFDGRNTGIYSIIIDGEWESEELISIQRKYTDLYAITACSSRNNLVSTNAPWRGGYSSGNFYHSLNSSLAANSGQLKALHYASPGYIEFYASRHISLEVKKNVDSYIAHKDGVTKLLQNLSTYIKNEGFNDRGVIVLTQEEVQILDRMSQDLLSYFSNPSWDWVSRSATDSFKAAKIVKSYCTRLKKISSFVLDERAMLAEI